MPARSTYEASLNTYRPVKGGDLITDHDSGVKSKLKKPFT